MCLSIPGKIVSIDGINASVDINGALVRSDISLLQDLKIGDYLLVHSGFAIQKYSLEEAQETLRLFQEMADNDRV
jgi:hydrogenase expression/formation protein HypC